MSPTEAGSKLQHFNDWRRGHHDDTAQPDPREIGEAIDAAIEMIGRLEAAEKERDALRARIEAIKPVAWQTRTRPAWNDGTWGPWRKCSEEYAEDIKKTPLLHDWLYEARTLYTLPGAQQCKNCNGMGDRFDPSGGENTL